MSLSPNLSIPPSPLDVVEQYVVSHGKGGALGVFGTPQAFALRRGARVVLRTARGLELGTVLDVATLRQARLLGAASAGQLLRPLTAEDEAQQSEREALARQIFETSRAWASRDGRAIEILDAEVLFDGRQAILQFLGSDIDLDPFAQSLEQHFQCEIRLENLAAVPSPDDHEEEAGCGKPDCGRGEGGCSSCSTGGGCSSCGSGKVDMTAYFAHLRAKMESQNRVSLL